MDRRICRRNNSSYSETKETEMEIIVKESEVMFDELKRRRNANGTTARQELDADPKFARKLFVLTGYSKDNCP